MSVGATSATIEPVLSHFEGVRRNGDHHVARCPAHDDHNASLSISTGRDGRVLLKCHAGCAAELILAAAGLAWKDLFPPRDENNNGHKSNGQQRIVATYDYQNSEGELLYQAVRYEPKDFRQRKPDGNGGWQWNMQGVNRVLYRLPDLIDAEPDALVYITEGEKDVDALRGLGLLATCNVGGALKWQREFSETLRGRACCIVADKDAKGREHAQQVATMLHGIAASVRIVECPGDGVKDAADYISGGAAANDFTRLHEAAAEWTPTADQTENPPQPKFTFHTATEFDELDLHRDYHIPSILAAGAVPTILAGSFKTLKTSVAMDLAVSLAAGARFLGHYPVSSRVRVAVMSGESGGFALQSLARRVAHAKGCTMAGIGDYLRVCTSVMDLSLRDDLKLIEQYIAEQDIRLLIIDPTYMALRGMRSDDAGNLFVVGRFLEPLARIAERTGCTPVVVHHNSRGATRANEGEPAELADIAWSGFAEWAGQWLLLSRRERYNPDSDGEHRLWLTAGGRDGHSTLAGVNITEGRQDDPGGRRWQVEVEQANRVRLDAVEAEQNRREQERESRRQKQRQADRETILNMIRTLSEGETKRTIRDRTGLRTDRFDPAFAELLTEGLIMGQEIRKGNGRTYDGYIASGPIGTQWDASGVSR